MLRIWHEVICTAYPSHVCYQPGLPDCADHWRPCASGSLRTSKMTRRLETGSELISVMIFFQRCNSATGQRITHPGSENQHVTEDKLYLKMHGKCRTRNGLVAGNIVTTGAPRMTCTELARTSSLWIWTNRYCLHEANERSNGHSVQLILLLADCNFLFIGRVRRTDSHSAWLVKILLSRFRWLSIITTNPLRARNPTT